MCFSTALLVPQLACMTGAAEPIDYSTWDADERLWFADMVAKVDGGSASTEQAVAILAELKTRPWRDCLRLEGNGESRHADTRGEQWSDDRKGRWFKTKERKIVWLQHELGWLRYRRARRQGEVTSHLCGFCDCIRLEHLVYQSVRDDRLDRAHHKRFLRGSFRVER